MHADRVMRRALWAAVLVNLPLRAVASAAPDLAPALGFLWWLRHPRDLRGANPA